ncbi:hypothetical protein B4119_2589 [Parageobacillus caldoxylosilyticus]|uniref:Uncharacterized protein n=1 Tax=Saccharococcus caldoxylosilyticus TaxID=81408 RepID=A0A150LBL5_9BACL|nr:hypothetical protein B4119_2589 [Parageobacillus caldoxylosilyticus]
MNRFIRLPSDMGRFDEKASFLITELAFFVQTKRPVEKRMTPPPPLF